MAEQEVAIEVGTERIRLLRLPEGATVQRVLVDGREWMPTDLKNAYDRGWIAGWRAHAGDAGGPVPVVVGPPGTDPGEASSLEWAARVYNSLAKEGFFDCGSRSYTFTFDALEDAGDRRRFLDCLAVTRG